MGRVIFPLFSKKHSNMYSGFGFPWLQGLPVDSVIFNIRTNPIKTEKDSKPFIGGGAVVDEKSDAKRINSRLLH
jgi:hypothetical protein